MSVTISQRTRRRLAEAICNKDEAEAFCDGLESTGDVASGDTLYLYVPIPVTFAAGDDIVAMPLASFDVGVTLEAVTLIADEAYQDVDASNTMVVAVKDQAGNTIVTKTFDDVTVPTDFGSDDLGTLNGTHKVLSANEACTVTVTNGATALPPGLTVLLQFHVT